MNMETNNKEEKNPFPQQYLEGLKTYLHDRAELLKQGESTEELDRKNYQDLRETIKKSLSWEEYQKMMTDIKETEDIDYLLSILK